MNKKKHLTELEKILKEMYPLLPLKDDAPIGVYTIEDLAKELNKEIESRINSPFLPGIEKNWDTIILDSLEAIRMDKKGYLIKVYNNIHPEHKELREAFLKQIENY